LRNPRDTDSGGLIHDLCWIPWGNRSSYYNPFCRARERRDGVVSLQRNRQAVFAKLLAAFARQTGAGRDRIIVLQLDNAGWHGPKNLPVTDGIRLVYQPPRSPELQPAERLWPLVDEPLVNKHFATIDDLDAAVAERCCFLLVERPLAHDAHIIRSSDLKRADCG
jgi:transposase